MAGDRESPRQPIGGTGPIFRGSSRENATVRFNRICDHFRMLTNFIDSLTTVARVASRTSSVSR
jgi:hypothetical protein